MITYRDAGVDVEAGYSAVKLMRTHVEKTYSQNVIHGLANFGGMYSMGKQGVGNEPVLVAGADGVGTKLKLAFALEKHDTIGIDCVAMCVNDVVCHGAKPLFFLDYIALGKLMPDRVATIVAGVAQGCELAGCALLGGETAEMPDFYKRDEYDLAGFAVGLVEREKLIDGSKVTEGNILIGLGSSGPHSNGFALIRRLFGDNTVGLNTPVHALGSTLSNELMKPTRIYVKTVLALCEAFPILGIAHITGGGFYENIPRILPAGLRARVSLSGWKMPKLFEFIALTDGCSPRDLFGTFNMGIGMVLCVKAQDAQSVVKAAASMGEEAYIIGEVVKGEAGVDLCD